MSVSCLKTLQISYFGKGSMLGYVHELVGKCMLPANLMAISEIKHHVRSQAVTNIVTMLIIIINTKNQFIHSVNGDGSKTAKII